MRANGGLQTLARSFIRNPNRRSRLLSHSSNPLVSIPPPSLLHSLLPSSSSSAVSPNPFPTYLGLFSPKIRRWVPFSGPLFLSCPAWKLSQSATPLHFPAKERIFPRELQQQSRIFRIESRAIASGKARIGAGEAREIAAGVRAEEQFLNLPNLVSISRMLSGPVIGWMIMNEWYLPAFCGLAISGATDWLDGFLARKMNVKSILGSYLDPLADKVLIGCVALAMVEKDLLHPGLVGLVVFRDVGLVGGAFYKRASNLGWEWKTWSEFFNLDATRQERMEPLLISKVNTVFQLLLVAAALLQPEFGSKDTQLYITYMSWLVATTTVASATAYGMQHLCKSIKIQS